MKKLLTWVDQRFPLTASWNKHAAQYYVPKNLNFWYFFGAFSFLVLLNQIVTGVWLTMYYIPTEASAFDSVQHIMRHVPYGWLIRYLHTTGASAFFVVLYLHMYRAVMYGSYQKPRELLWLIGMLLYVALMAEAFTGYVLPWGQMSFWAAKVIMSLLQAIPGIGEHFSMWIQGDYTVTGNTLHRFFAYHVSAIPMTIVLLVLVHIVSLHKVGSNNPDGVEIKHKKNKAGNPVDGITFHPFYTLKDLWGMTIFLIIFALIVFYFPKMQGYFLEKENFLPANPLATPQHIAPVWYLAPFYAVLRAVPDKLGGIIAMAASVAVLFVLPWLDRSKVRSIRYKGHLSKIALTIFVICFVGLGYIGTQPATDFLTLLARIFTVGYFSFFILMPLYTRLEVTKQPPESLT